MAICLGAAAAIAADEPQAVRQAQMKQIGASVGALGAIAKGEKPYDADTVKKALSTIAADAKDFPNHFPAGSEDLERLTEDVREVPLRRRVAGQRDDSALAGQHEPGLMGDGQGQRRPVRRFVVRGEQCRGTGR